MAPRDRLREELNDDMGQTDRRVIQPRGEIDVSDLDADDIGQLRDEEINNLNENELDLLDAHVGVARQTEEHQDILPVEKLDRELADEEE